MHAWECLGLGYLASFSYKFGYCRDQYRFFSGEFDNDETIIAGCLDAEIIAFSVTTFQIPHAERLVQEIKRKNPSVKVVWGGYGISGLTADKLENGYGDLVDFFVQGPGEEAWLEILTNPDPPRVIRKGLIADLNEVPFPDRELIRIDRNLAKLESGGEGRKTSMEMQRGGCPFECVFCAAPSYTKIHGKTRTPENIVDEMVELRDRWGMDGSSMVLMCDAEVFLTSTMREVGQLKMDRKVDFKFGMNVIASDVAKPTHWPTLEILANAGLEEVWMGVEAGPSLMHLTNKPINPDQVRQAFKITRDLGIIRKAYFILGFTPFETKETILERIDFIEEIDPDVVGFSLYIPVPGSKGYDHQKHHQIDYAKSCEYFNTYTRTETLTNEELQYWQNYLVDYFSDRITYRQQNNETNSMIRLKELAGRSGY
jgi:radical SAM superfamily enzyme YgiQ (UPF0313 family)